MMVRPLVLVVDDEPQLLEVVRDVLEDSGCDVMTAKCGEDAKAILETVRPDLVITDIMMANGNGLRLRDTVKTLNIPVMFVSGYQKAYSQVMGTTPLVEKPFEFDELLNTVHSCINGSRHG